MKKTIITAFAFSLSVGISAQDILTMRSGTTYDVKVLEITDHDLRFKMKNNPDGPLYIISRNSFSSIRYENGVTEELALEQPPEQTIQIGGVNTNIGGAITYSQTIFDSAVTDFPIVPRPSPPPVEKDASFGEFLGAILFTGLMALSIAADVDQSNCTQQHQHSNCCR